MIRIESDYKKREGELIITGNRVVNKMENNEDYPNPPEALTKLKGMLPELQRAMARARGRDKLEVAIKNKIKAEVRELVQELADYVLEVSKDNRTLILSSGFLIDNENDSGKREPAIEKLLIDFEIPGEVTIRAKNVTNAIAFVHQYTTEPPTANTKWYGEGSSLGRYTLKGLESTKRYWFRIVAIGYFGKRGYSPIVSKIVQ